jgi:small-conductance mechanosensitive channel
VEEIRFTYTFIRTSDNRRVVIPNEAFASQVVNNYSLGTPGSMVAVDFVIPMGAGLEQVRREVLAIAEELAPAPEGKTDSVTVEALGADSVSLRLHAWAHDPYARRDLASDLRAAILQRLLEDGILGSAGEATEAD